MTNLAKALKETYKVDILKGEEVYFEHNYQTHTLVDVVIVGVDGSIFFYEAYDCAAGCFPY